MVETLKKKTFSAIFSGTLKKASLDVTGFSLSKPFHRIVLASFNESQALMRGIRVLISRKVSRALSDSRSVRGKLEGKKRVALNKVFLTQLYSYLILELGGQSCPVLTPQTPLSGVSSRPLLTIPSD